MDYSTISFGSEIDGELYVQHSKFVNTDEIHPESYTSDEPDEKNKREESRNASIQ